MEYPAAQEVSGAAAAPWWPADAVVSIRLADLVQLSMWRPVQYVVVETSASFNELLAEIEELRAVVQRLSEPKGTQAVRGGAYDDDHEDKEEYLSITSPSDNQDRDGDEEEIDSNYGGGDRTPTQDGLVPCTSVKLRNIPKNFTRDMLVEQLNLDFRGLFDFLYLPPDFKTHCNVGHCFINFRSSFACDRFRFEFDGEDVQICLPGPSSKRKKEEIWEKRIAEVTPARVQGLEENIRRLRTSPVMSELVCHPEWMPLLFDEQGEEQTFLLADSPFLPSKQHGQKTAPGPTLTGRSSYMGTGVSRRRRR